MSSPGERAAYFAGFDIGGTKVSLILADAANELVHSVREPTGGTEASYTRYRDGVAYYGLSAQMVRLLRRALKDTRIDAVEGIGIGSAGPMRHGGLENPPNISRPSPPSDLPATPVYVPLVDPLVEQFGVPTLLDNDGSAAVLGEVYHGVGSDEPDKNSLHLVYITLSTGFGGGIWDGGSLIRGKDGNTEVGHIVVRDGGLRCGCGNQGCAEAYCSGSGIALNARSRLVEARMPPHSRLLELAAQQASEANAASTTTCSSFHVLEYVTPPLVFQAADEGDPIAVTVVQDACHYGGIALGNIANAYDPSVITVGGSIALNHPSLVKRMEEQMQQHLKVRRPTVCITPLGQRVVEYGSLELARRAALAGSTKAAHHKSLGQVEPP